MCMCMYVSSKDIHWTEAVSQQQQELTHREKSVHHVHRDHVGEIWAVSCKTKSKATWEHVKQKRIPKDSPKVRPTPATNRLHHPQVLPNAIFQQQPFWKGSVPELHVESCCWAGRCLILSHHSWAPHTGLPSHTDLKTMPVNMFHMRCWLDRQHPRPVHMGTCKGGGVKDP